MQAAAMDTLVQQLPGCCRSSSFTVQCGCGERWRVEEQSSFPGYNLSLEQDYSKPLRMESCCERDCNDDRGRRCPENLVSSTHAPKDNMATKSKRLLPLSMSLSPCV